MLVESLWLAATATAAMAGAGVSKRPGNRSGGFFVNVGFAFEVGKQTLPAGRYRFEPMNSKTSVDDTTILIVWAADGATFESTACRIEASVRAQSRSKVVFHRYGDRCVLREVWEEGSATGLVLDRAPAGRKHGAASESTDVEPREIELYPPSAPSFVVSQLGVPVFRFSTR
jgi:hypothetical protein